MADTSPRRKKLIEVALPLEAISEESSRRKRKAPKGYPTTLHWWYAQRPVAACRAVIFSSLVDDPSSDPAFRNADGTVDEDRAGLRRTELFDLIEQLVLWENSNNPAVINAARAEIAASVVSSKVELGELQKDTIVFGKSEGKPHPDGPMADDGGTAWRVMLRRSKPEIVNHVLATYAPLVLDPFAGGGSIPLEAQRLGLRAHASDLNPVAVLINKALIEIPPKFADQPPVHPDAETKTGWSGASGLAEDVRRYGQWMRDEAEQRIGRFYPKVKITEAMTKDRPDLKPYVGQELTVIAWLWARTVTSPNPAFAGVHVPLAASFWLSKKKGKEAWVKPVVDREGKAWSFKVMVGKPSDNFDPSTGTVKRAGGTCLLSESPMPFDHIREEGKAGRMQQRLMAIVCEGHRGRIYLDPLPEQEQIAQEVIADDYPITDLPEKALGFRIQLYGMDQHWKLFTPRQLTASVTFSDLVGEARARALANATAAQHLDPRAYADAVATYLAFAVSRMLDYNSAFATWRAKDNAMRSTIGKQALPMVWDFAEANPLAKSSSGCVPACKVVASAVELLPAGIPGAATQADASRPSLSGEYVCCTDPPYYDNVGYADLSDFFFIWLRRSLKDVYPDLSATVLTPKSDEIIASPYRHAGGAAEARQFFESRLGDAFFHVREHADPFGRITIFYAFKQSESDDTGDASTGWETFLTAVINRGLVIHATWPMRTEGDNRQVGIDTNALASSIVLACSPRPGGSPMATRREFADALRAELPEAIRHLQSGNVAPVDLAQASIGPGVSVFSRYSKVVNADGTPMSVREALQLINHVLDEALTEQEGDFDAETRFALKWFEQYGVKEGPFGDAETLAKAMAVSVQGVVESGVAVSRAGKVRLLRSDELDPAWDPQTDTRLTIWEVSQHLIRELEQSGEPAAADLLRRVGSGAGQTARELAYRLYQTCERKKWADWARSYNGLVVSWPEIEKLARERPRTEAAAQSEMF